MQVLRGLSLTKIVEIHMLLHRFVSFFDASEEGVVLVELQQELLNSGLRLIRQDLCCLCVLLL